MWQFISTLKMYKNKNQDSVYLSTDIELSLPVETQSFATVIY